MMEPEDIERMRLRSLFVVAVFAFVWLVLIGRAVDLQVLENEFLTEQGDARHLRVVKISAHRGSIVDREGEPLAVSTPVDSVWAHPGELLARPERIPALAEALDADPAALTRLITSRADREFVYLRRHLSPEAGQQVMAVGAPGVNLLREYRRYYPAGEVVAHLLGFTDIDDRGQEGLELSFNDWLSGSPGAKRVVKDRLGRAIRDVERIEPMRPGRELMTSVDLRLQYLAYRELKSAVQHHRARSGSVVVLDVLTGEVLAMANQPSFNPNDRSQLRGELFRNRAITDVFEPGSAIKPFIIAAALESGRYTADTRVETGEGRLEIGASVVRDSRPHGDITVSRVLEVSSNVGASTIALDLEPAQLWRTLDDFGFGRETGIGYPGESAGLLSHHSQWRRIGQATLAYGYGLSVTPLQLAQAYAVIGAGGVMRQPTFVRQEEPVSGQRVLPRRTAAELMRMMENVVSLDGTGGRAAIRGYRVAGKTGTARKYVAGGYSEDRHMAAFAGLAPASAPRVAVVVVIDEPGAGAYYGGEVAAPVFARIAAGAMRLLDIPPDGRERRTRPDELVAAGDGTVSRR